MKRLGILSLFLLILWSCGTQKTAKVERQWYKGNLHTHSYWSDGDEFPEMIMGWYKDHGYDFVGLSDHNTLAAGEKWKLVPKGRVYKDAFYTYLEKYGKDWVEYKEDTGRVSVKLKTF
ncbi:MAG: histidinol-phosphatase, partial [Imperialibacter sp.]